eukprot:s253_g11.t5
MKFVGARAAPTLTMVRLLLATYLCTQAFGLVAREETTLALEKAPLPAPAMAMPHQAATATAASTKAAPTYAPAPVVAPFSAKILRPILGETASQYGQHQWWVVVRTIIGWIVLAYGVWMWTWWLPSLYFRMHEDYLKEDIEGRSFQQYLTYHFNYWMTAGGIGAMFKLLGIGILTLLTIGSFIYAILMQDSPVRGLWLCTVWASAASVDPAVTAMEGGVGMLLTFGALVLLAVLLTTISDFFAAQQKKSNEGRDPIVEGGHLVLLGLSSQTKDFLEELAICEANSAPKTIAILDTMPKSEIEEEIKRQNTNTGDLKIVCRGGLPSSAEDDLWKVGADVCSRIVILDEPSLPRDEADSIAFGTLLTLRGQGKTGWPNNGHISVQCCLGKNVGFMNELYPGKTFVLSGERLGRLMVQSARDQGLCPIFNAIIGFEGDEFYAAKALDIGVVGRTFQEVPFWCEKTVPIGIRDASGAYIINPEKSYKVKMDDEVIVLAEDDDAIQRMPEPMMDFQESKQEAVHAFARCLTGVGDMSKQVFYEVTRTSAGFQASLRVPAWSNQPDEGEVMPNEKRAKQSAAHVFKTDPEVMEMPRNFPKGVMRLTNVAFCARMKKASLDVPCLVLAWRNKYGASTFVEADPNDNEKVQVLICNFTERGYGCAILFALDEMVAPGSVCDIFCSLTEEDARAIVSNAEEEQDRRLKNIEVRRIYTTAQHQMTAQHKLNMMPLQDYDFHFILADSALGFQKARAPDLEFNPLVEICTSNAHAQLGLLGIENTINTISMMSRAMALVAIDTLAHGVLSDLLSATGNNMDIMTLRDYLGQQRLPSQISFAEITAMVNRAAQQVVIGWSERDSDGNKVWVVNPKEKLQPRVWNEEDRIVVIKDV